MTSLETAYDVLTAVEKIGQVTDLELENEKENNHNFVSDNHALKVEFKNIFYQYFLKFRFVLLSYMCLYVYLLSL